MRRIVIEYGNLCFSENKAFNIKGYDPDDKLVFDKVMITHSIESNNPCCILYSDDLEATRKEK